jgi:hypothetical protein
LIVGFIYSTSELEQHNARLGAVSLASNVFAMAVIFYEAITRKLPFGTSDSDTIGSQRACAKHQRKWHVPISRQFGDQASEGPFTEAVKETSRRHTYLPRCTIAETNGKTAKEQLREELQEACSRSSSSAYQKLKDVHLARYKATNTRTPGL